MTQRSPTASQLLTTPGALLHRGHLRELGLERRAIDAAFRDLPNVTFPGYSRSMIWATDYLDYAERSTARGKVPERTGK